MKTQNKPIGKLIVVLFLALVLGCSKDEGSIEPIAQDPCSENPCSNPDQCPDSCADNTNGGGTEGITKDNITPEGNVTETENGYTVEGKLTIETESEDPVVFAEAELDVQFNDDGSVKSISGTTEIPSPSNYFEFETPVRADIGFFNGKFLNENRDFEIKLKDERSYFVFAIAAAFELKIGANDDPDATKPLSISPPIGGHITLIADYSDPMFFYSLGADDGLGNGDGDGGNGNNGGGGDGSNGDGGSDLLGVSFGASFGANLVYEPTVPVENVVSFDANTVTGGTFSFWKVLEASGLYYQNKGFSADLNLKEPMESEFGYGYRAGINGELDFSLDITSFISFGFPIGEGSAAIVAEATTDNGVTARAFVNGIVDPDLSWWPELIPVKPNGKLNTYGYVDQTGAFDIGLSGMYGLEMPSGTQSLEGALQATNEAFTLTGEVTVDDEVWGASAIFTKDETKCIASPPTNFAEGISETVTEQIDSAIVATEQAIDDLEKANENYELELSLRGLRAALPGIIDDAQDAIDDAVSAGVKSGRDQADDILEENNRALCSDNISSKVNGLVKPYRDALNRLKDAVDDSNDNDRTRAELEAALRQLAGLNRINESVTVSITHGNKAIRFVIAECVQKSTVTRTVSINRTILSADQVARLTEAADNVKYIAEADGIRFDAQIIVDELPTMEELENLKNNIEGCVAELTEGIGDVGFVYNHDTKEYMHFMVINGEEREMGTFDIFNGDQVISSARLELGSCDGSEALKQLMEKYK